MASKPQLEVRVELKDLTELNEEHVHNKVEALVKGLIQRKFLDEAIEVSSIFSEIGNIVSKECPLTSSNLGSYLKGDYPVFQDREALRRELYDANIKRFEYLLIEN